ncbi:hypothetical protein K3120_004009 [Salmonella enterica]|nr:hypothetical protein [Salmonella enterica]EBD0837740.1 hypothetical protein [Salmonella enterica]EHX7449857.1 hypothetical protein [Salmonella enterica]
MPKFAKEIIVPKSYSINNTTLLAAMGLCFFVFSEIILIINAVARLFASVWMYSYEGSSPARSGTAFLLAAVCFFIAIFCHKGFQHCLFKLRQHQIPN